MTRKEYMYNPYLTELNAKVLMSRKVDNFFQLVLDRTIFYPDRAGGQKGDIGKLNGIPVEKSIIEDEKIIHLTKTKVPGSEVKIEIDWENRYDVMQQHTAQHLLSACFHVLYDAKTVGFHMNEDFSVIDIEIDFMDEETISRIESLANDIIRYNFDVLAYFPSEVELKNINFRKDPLVDHNLRVIEIEGFDFSACGGTHVKSTGEIGMIKIINYERHRGNFRLHVVAGKKALKDYTVKNDLVNKLNTALSSNNESLINNFQNKIDTIIFLEEEYRKLKFKYMELLKENLLTKMKEQNSNVLIERFNDLPFKDVNQFSKMFSDLETIAQVYYIENNEWLNFYISLTDKSIYNLENIKTILKSNYSLKGGGDLKTLQGSIFLDKGKDPKEIFAEVLLKSIIR